MWPPCWLPLAPNPAVHACTQEHSTHEHMQTQITLSTQVAKQCVKQGQTHNKHTCTHDRAVRLLEPVWCTQHSPQARINGLLQPYACMPASAHLTCLLISHTCVSTGHSLRPRQNSMTHAMLLGPTPLYLPSWVLMSSQGSSRRCSRLNSPRSSRSDSRIACG
jgi:hypothetical protein